MERRGIMVTRFYKKNMIDIMLNYFKLLNIDFSYKMVGNFLSQHPYPESILAITDFFSFLKMEVFTAKLEYDQLFEIPLPAIVFSSSSGSNTFLILKEISKNYLLTVDHKGNIIKWKRHDFLNLWSGYTIISDNTPIIKQYSTHRAEIYKTILISLGFTLLLINIVYPPWDTYGRNILFIYYLGTAFLWISTRLSLAEHTPITLLSMHKFRWLYISSRNIFHFKNLGNQIRYRYLISDFLLLNSVSLLLYPTMGMLFQINFPLLISLSFILSLFSVAVIYKFSFRKIYRTLFSPIFFSVFITILGIYTYFSLLNIPFHLKSFLFHLSLSLFGMAVIFSSIYLLREKVVTNSFISEGELSISSFLSKKEVINIIDKRPGENFELQKNIKGIEINPSNSAEEKLFLAFNPYDDYASLIFYQFHSFLTEGKYKGSAKIAFLSGNALLNQFSLAISEYLVKYGSDRTYSLVANWFLNSSMNFDIFKNIHPDIIITNNINAREIYSEWQKLTQAFAINNRSFMMYNGNIVPYGLSLRELFDTIC